MGEPTSRASRSGIHRYFTRNPSFSDALADEVLVEALFGPPRACTDLPAVLLALREMGEGLEAMEALESPPGSSPPTSTHRPDGSPMYGKEQQYGDGDARNEGGCCVVM